MTSDRVYRPAISIEAALAELKRHAGTQFDETVVDAFCNNITPHQSSTAEPDLNTIIASTGTPAV
jgi:HD-GYP domain-containing protein (c-di-GMP phosphodiesterase class II)